MTIKASLIFGKRFMIFPKLNSSSLPVHLISDCQNLAIVCHQNLAGAGIRQHQAIGNLPAQKSGDIWSLSPESAGQILAGIWTESGQGQKLAEFGKNGRNPVIFSCKPNAEKYVLENNFFKKIISLKIFYDGNYFTSKQIEHKKKIYILKLVS